MNKSEDQLMNEALIDDNLVPSIKKLDETTINKIGNKYFNNISISCW